MNWRNSKYVWLIPYVVYFNQERSKRKRGPERQNSTEESEQNEDGKCSEVTPCMDVPTQKLAGALWETKPQKFLYLKSFETGHWMQGFLLNKVYPESQSGHGWSQKLVKSFIDQIFTQRCQDTKPISQPVCKNLTKHNQLSLIVVVWR